jgi:hypothetical protein
MLSSQQSTRLQDTHSSHHNCPGQPPHLQARPLPCRCCPWRCGRCCHWERPGPPLPGPAPACWAAPPPALPAAARPAAWPAPPARLWAPPGPGSAPGWGGAGSGMAVSKSLIATLRAQQEWAQAKPPGAQEAPVCLQCIVPGHTHAMIIHVSCSQCSQIPYRGHMQPCPRAGPASLPVRGSCG